MIFRAARGAGLGRVVGRVTMTRGGLALISGLLSAPVLVMLVLAAMTIRDAKRTRQAVLESGDRIADLILRDALDGIYLRLGQERVDLIRAAEADFRRGDRAAVRTTMDAAIPDVPPCERCRGRVPIAGVSVAGVVADDAERSARLTPELVGLVGREPRRPHLGLGGTARDPWIGMFAAPVDDPAVVVAIWVDPHRIGPELLAPELWRSATVRVRPPDHLEGTVGFRVEHPSGAVLLDAGIADPMIRYSLPLFGDEPVVRSATPSVAATVTIELSEAYLDRVLPGGVPHRSTALVVVLLSLAALVSLLAIALVHGLRRAITIREEFVSGVSHELRTPLTQILLYAEALQMPASPPELRDRAGDVIVRETRRLIHLVENTLGFVRGQRPEAAFVPMAHDLAALAREVVADLQPLTARQGLILRLAAPEPVVAMVDAAMVRRALSNLIDNASRHGETATTVTIDLATEEGWAVLGVEDDGVGIPAADRERVFDPFVRVRNGPAAAAQGAGLGLAIVRQVVQLHGGRIEVDAPGAHGVRFRLWFPLAPADAPASQPLRGEES